MPDIPPPAPGKTPDEIALGCVTYIMRRVFEDPNAAWLFGWRTESFRQLCLAYAALTGESFEEVERKSKEAWMRCPRDSDVERLQRRIKELEERA